MKNACERLVMGITSYFIDSNHNRSVDQRCKLGDLTLAPAFDPGTPVRPLRDLRHRQRVLE